MKAQITEKEGKHYIKGKVVMLEAKNQTHQVKEGDLFINDTSKYFWGELEALRCERVTQHGHAWNGTGIRTDICHLYITSDDEIKVGDWYLIEFNGLKITQCTSEEELISLDKRTDCKKIIATTDTSLKDICFMCNGMKEYLKNICSECDGEGVLQNLPQPSESFTRAYIESYNNGNVIENVLVEVNIDLINEFSSGDTPTIFDIKIKDNNIIIKKVKDSWNREEVIELIKKYESDMYSVTSKEQSKWIEENL